MKKTFDDVVAALQAGRERTALTALRSMVEHQSDAPQRLLMTCAHLLRASDPTSGDTVVRVRAIQAEVDKLSDDERRLFHACVYSTETRADLVTDPNELAALLRGQPAPIGKARRSVRWLTARTDSYEREAVKICETLLTNPSATHPLIVDAIQQSYQIWPNLDGPYRALVMSCVYVSRERAEIPYRALVMSCVYVSRERAEIANQRRAARTRQNEAETGDIHRCGNCDGNLSMAPDMPFCSSTCRHEAATFEGPQPTNQPAPPPAAPVAHYHEPAEQRARRSVVRRPIEIQYDERRHEIVPDIPMTGRARKDDAVADRYDENPGVAQEIKETPDKTWLKEEYEFEARTMRPLATPDALCISCNLERTPAEYRAEPTGRCDMCAEVGAASLNPEWRSELIAA